MFCIQSKVTIHEKKQKIETYNQEKINRNRPRMMKLADDFKVTVISMHNNVKTNMNQETMEDIKM